MVRCESCSFGPGARTGEIHRYEDHSGQIDLCDDCVRMAKEVYGLDPKRVEWDPEPVNNGMPKRF